MNRDVNPTLTITTLAIILACLCFFLWRFISAPFDNPVPPEIQPGPTGHIAAPPIGGMPHPGYQAHR